MPLSEYEQRVLDQLERDLGADPSLGRTMARRPRSRVRLVLGVGGIAAGLAVLVAGVASKIEALGIVGFALMAGAALWLLLAPHKRTAGPGAAASAPRKRRRSDAGLMSRLEERFEKRRREGL